jgi:hypothetical protein
MQAQRPTFYIDCRKNIFELFVTKNFFGKKFPPCGRAANKVLTREIFLPVYRCPKNGVLTVHYGIGEITVNVRKMLKNPIGLICCFGGLWKWHLTGQLF